jgi:hypothetical protein
MEVIGPCAEAVPRKSNAGLLRRMRLRAAEAKRFGAAARLDVSSNQQTVNNLIARWKPVFTYKDFDPTASELFARRVQCEALPGSWVCSFDQFVKIPLSQRISALGPDGLSHSF